MTTPRTMLEAARERAAHDAQWIDLKDAPHLQTGERLLRRRAVKDRAYLLLLVPYLRHKDGCWAGVPLSHQSEPQDNFRQDCSCGLTALLERKEC